MSVKIRVQRGKIYLDIYQNGVRKWESLHLSLSDNKQQNKELLRLAEACRSKREAQLLSGEWNIKIETSKKISLAQYIKDYAKNSNQKSLTTLLNHIKKYQNGATISLNQVTSKWIEDFQTNLLKSKKTNGKTLSQSSVGLYMKMLRAIFRKAMTERLITQDPMTTIAVTKIITPEMIYLSAEELKKLAKIVPEDDFGKEVRRAFLFACFTGLRVSDLETLTWGMIDKENAQITKAQQKTKNVVYIPLNKSAMALISGNAEHFPDEKVFALGTHRISSYKVLKDWAAEAGITKNIGWHTARRTFATLALGGGADVITVAKLLGHSGLSQVMKYAKATDAMKRRAVDSLPALCL